MTGQVSRDDPRRCDGSGMEATKTRPTVFARSAERTTCPVCGRDMPVTRGRVYAHLRPSELADPYAREREMRGSVRETSASDEAPRV